MTNLSTEAAERTDRAVLSRAGVEAFSRRRGEPDWLRESRLAAWERYEAAPKPTTRDEGWRRTDLSGLDLERLAAPSVAGAPGGGDLSGAIGSATAQAGLLVLRDGAVERVELDEALAGRGVRLMSLAEAVRREPDLVRRFFDQPAERPQASKLTALAEALWADGAFLYVPRGLVVDAPFQIVHWGAAPGAALSRTLVVADEAAGLTVIDTYASPDGRDESLSSGAVDVLAGQAARVFYLNLQERDERCWDFTNLHTQQERDSALTYLSVGLGGCLGRTELTCSLRGQGVEADLIGLVFGEEGQRFDLQSLQDHVGSDTRSDLVHRVALRGRSSSNFTGLIRVGLKALRTASNQVSRNLLLSEGARADSDPKLEILNSDVIRCGHGAAVGPVDEEMIFYLRTRGLSQDEAQRLIVEGFFAPLLDRVPLESVRERLWASIARKLGR